MNAEKSDVGMMNDNGTGWWASETSARSFPRYPMTDSSCWDACLREMVWGMFFLSLPPI
jgi:hypothetical protein